jgi:hypothetical protein
MFKTVHNNVVHTHHDNFVRDKINGKQLIITVIRNLYDRNISAFFQNIDNKGHFWYDPHYTESKIDNIIYNYRKKNIEHTRNVISKWYDNFNKKLNIDIFKKKFDTDEKYTIYNTNEYTFLVLRYEDIKEWDNIFKKIFVNKLKKIPNSNTTKEKKCGEIFREFKEKYKISDEEIDEINKVDVMKHFYIKEDKDNMIAKYI